MYPFSIKYFFLVLQADDVRALLQDAMPQSSALLPKPLVAPTSVGSSPATLPAPAPSPSPTLVPKLALEIPVILL